MILKPFALSDIFEPASGDFDIQQKHLNGIGEYVVSSGETNMGIIGKTNVEAKIFDANTITVDMFGNVYFRSYRYKMVTHARVFSLKLKPEIGQLSKESGLYMVAAMQYFRQLYSYSKMASWKKCSHQTIELPADGSGNIDFNYMAARIRELEAARIRELEAYLRVTGLSEYVLTESEIEFLRAHREREVKPFRLGDLFYIHPTKTYGLTNDKLFTSVGSTPVIVNSSRNNGIGGYINLPPTEQGNIITFSDTTTADSIFYQPNPFIGYSHVQGVYPIHPEKWDRESLLYIVSIFRKATAGRFNYATKFTRKIASNLILYLPVNINDEIDYDCMTAYIKIQQKLVIQRLAHQHAKVSVIEKQLTS